LLQKYILVKDVAYIYECVYKVGKDGFLSCDSFLSNPYLFGK